MKKLMKYEQLICEINDVQRQIDTKPLSQFALKQRTKYLHRLTQELALYKKNKGLSNGR